MYGLPVAINKIADLSALWEAVSTHGAIVRLMIDNLAQVEALEAFESARLDKRKWSVFIKCDGGQRQVLISLVLHPYTEYFRLVARVLFPVRWISKASLRVLSPLRR